MWSLNGKKKKTKTGINLSKSLKDQKTDILDKIYQKYDKSKIAGTPKCSVKFPLKMTECKFLFILTKLPHVCENVSMSLNLI